MFTQKDAFAIAKKLKATITTGKNHDLVDVSYNGKTVATYGISRASRDKGHNYVPGQIHVTGKQARLLVQCPMSFDDWVGVMKEKHLIN